MKLKWRDVEPSDYLPNWDVMVTEVYTDDDGLWVETDDGDCGYVNPKATVEVDR